MQRSMSRLFILFITLLSLSSNTLLASENTHTDSLNMHASMAHDTALSQHDCCDKDKQPMQQSSGKECCDKQCDNCMDLLATHPYLTNPLALTLFNFERDERMSLRIPTYTEPTLDILLPPIRLS